MLTWCLVFVCLSAATDSPISKPTPLYGQPSWWGEDEDAANIKQERGGKFPGLTIFLLFIKLFLVLMQLYLSLKQFCVNVSLIFRNGSYTSVILVLICCDMNFYATAIWYAEWVTKRWVVLSPGHVSGHHLWKVCQTIAYHAKGQWLSASWWIMTLKAAGGGRKDDCSPRVVQTEAAYSCWASLCWTLLS